MSVDYVIRGFACCRGNSTITALEAMGFHEDGLGRRLFSMITPVCEKTRALTNTRSVCVAVDMTSRFHEARIVIPTGQADTCKQKKGNLL